MARFASVMLTTTVSAAIVHRRLGSDSEQKAGMINAAAGITRRSANEVPSSFDGIARYRIAKPIASQIPAGSSFRRPRFVAKYSKAISASALAADTVKL